jgi:hypothetical protein
MADRVLVFSASVSTRLVSHTVWVRGAITTESITNKKMFFLNKFVSAVRNLKFRLVFKVLFHIINCSVKSQYSCRNTNVEHYWLNRLLLGRFQ